MQIAICESIKISYGNSNENEDAFLRDVDVASCLF